MKNTQNLVHIKYRLDALIKNVEAGDRIRYLFFWGHQQSKTGEITSTCLSQWWVAPFTVDGVTYRTAEHWMMSRKALLFNDQDNHQKILAAGSPAEAKKIGRQIKDFEETTWNEKRYGIVVEGSLHKFSQNEALRNFLLHTNDRVLVEASPVDQIWGIGLPAHSNKAENPAQWNGLNLLGFALMEARDLIRKEK